MMKIYNEAKTQILTDYDLSLGYLKEDTITTEMPEIQEVKEEGHYETIKEYPNGGKDVKWVIDKKGVKYQPAQTKTEDIYVYIPYTQSELEEMKLNELRYLRETDCFTVINRGQLWYNTLAAEQLEELNVWYKAWLDVTETKVIPVKPSWLK